MGSHVLTRRESNEGSKQVRVDNWGVFFLQRLQTFFNNTDYCDLTLQFGTSYQLKVHRLVLNACTEYFQELEQTCDKIDDVLMMPSDLQADVVLPIINFMYTGMLEFHTSIFEKLHETASLMNITVLTKLLDAQKVPSTFSNKATKKNSGTWHSASKRMQNKNQDPDLPAPLPGRKLPVWKRKSAPVSVPHTVIPHYYQEQKRSSVSAEPLVGVDNTPKPTRFEWPEDELSPFNLFDSSFNEISYTSKPLTTQDDEPRASTSFDRIRDSPDVNNQRSSRNYGNLDIDFNDVRDYVKEQRIRSSINMNEDDDTDIDNDCDNSIGGTLKRKTKFEDANAKRVRFNTHEKENQAKEPKINVTAMGKTNSDMDHKKLISEVLKKYPNLVKKNKSIRLKILAKSNNEPVSIDEVRKNAFKKTSKPDSVKLSKTAFIEDKGEDEGPWKCLRCSTPEEPVEFVLYYLYRKHMTDLHNERFDARMCKYCGHKSTKYSMLLYHQYTRHCIKPPPTYKFPKCPRCPFIAFSDLLLTRHQMNHTKFESQCPECQITFCNDQMLTSHLQITGHNGKSIRSTYDCQYCSKRFPAGSNLFVHIRQQHREDARRDGIVSLDEMEEDQMELIESEQQHLIKHEVQYAPGNKREKVKILQDVKLPSNVEVHEEGSNTLTLEPSSESESLSNVASGIATSLSLVDVVVLDENQQYILHTDSQEGITSGEPEYILPEIQDEQSYTTTQQHSNVLTQSMLHGANIGSTDELVMVLTDHDYGDETNNELINNENSNIVVLYSHPIDGQENQFITSQGNLMLTSQAGLIELRNGNTVVTSNNSHFLTTTTDSQDSSHIESIEMIQREINQHPDMKSRLSLVETIKPTLVQEVDTDSITIPSNENIQNEESPLLSQDISAVEENVEQKPDLVCEEEEEENTNGEDSSRNDSGVFQDNSQDMSQETVSSASEVSLEKTKESIEEVDEPMEQDSGEKSESTENISNVGENPSNLEENTSNLEENTSGLEENASSLEENAINLQENAEPMEQDLSDVKNGEEESSSGKQDTSIVEIQSDESEKEIVEIENTTTIEVSEDNSKQVQEVDNKNTLTKSIEVQVIAVNSEEKLTSSDEKEPITIEISTDSSELPEKDYKSVIIRNNNNPTRASAEEQDEASNSSIKDSAEESEVILKVQSEDIPKEIQDTPQIEKTNESAKVILDDWEDTDSQQSDSKSGTNVNKLIDDWDDDEEESKKV